MTNEIVGAFMEFTLTEERNPLTRDIDTLPTLDMLTLINDEDQKVALAVRGELPNIAIAVDAITARMQRGGRLIYIGAGTSGRLGVLDASECPPTFGTPPELVVGLIAGGPAALTEAVEGAEDDWYSGTQQIAELNVNENDCVIGIAASGRTPYAIGGLQEAKKRGALTISIACNRPSSLEGMAEIGITPVVGPEVVSGSTRLKAGTAQKMVLNMISTAVMIRLGKTYSNLMVDVQPTNVKLRQRALRIVAEATGLDLQRATEVLTACNGEVKTAIVAILAEVSPEIARIRLHETGGYVRKAIG
ncbi:MAG TPA: N-acetylmuramic acid 6-phosphate etherase [Anaerolineales bacterium]|nr:N-acetylmuramic acid 6-phosphate etherase [Anaerolineales bacterium]